VDVAAQIERASIQLYTVAAQHALARGVILADTKFEFGLVSAPSPTTSNSASETLTQQSTLILIDEVLTPDSSRYWPLASYAPGRAQPSFDKQYVRDWLLSQGFQKGVNDGAEHEWVASEEVVAGTRARYEEAVRLLTGPPT
jgi:phosphoribosylaminoimidazole-succinocarboxamide synthase